MDDYIPKPIRRNELNRVIASVVSPATRVHPANESGNASNADSPGELLPDWDAALAAMDGDSQLLREVVDAALEELPQLMQRLERAFAEEDTQAIGENAHTIKGCLRPFELQSVERLTGELEQAAQSGVLDNQKQSLNQLQSLVQRLMQEMQRHRR